MNVLFFVLCVLLLFSNLALVYYIRTSRTFAIYPGFITVFLILLLGSYLVYMLVNTSPTPPPQAKNYKQSVYFRKYAKDQSAYIYHKMEAELQVAQQIENVNLLLNLIIFQSVLAIAAASAGIKLIARRKTYYTWVLALYVCLIFISLAAQYLIHHRHS